MATRRSDPFWGQHQQQQPRGTTSNEHIYADFIRNSTQRNQRTPENPRTQHGNRSPPRGGFYEDMRFQAAALEEQRRREMERERRQRGPPPASRVALKNIPYITIAAHDLVEETNRSCSVCLDDFELGGKAVKLPCAHIFHRECVWEWLEMHCTCPVCRFELETEDKDYERDRRVRMKGRRPRYRRRELDGLTIPQIRDLARQQNVDISRCLEKKDIVRAIVNSGMVELVESETPTYDADELSQMSMRQLRSLMLQAGIEVDGCLERSDLLDRIHSSRLVTVMHRDPLAPSDEADVSSSTTRTPPAYPAWNASPAAAAAAAPATAAPPAGAPPAAARPAPARPAPAVGARPAPAVGARPAPSATARTSASRANASSNARPAPPSSGGGGWGGGHVPWASMFNWGSRTGGGGSGGRPSQSPAPTPLESMSVKDLRGIMGQLGVSTQGCIEKVDMVERIKACGRYREGYSGGR